MACKGWGQGKKTPQNYAQRSPQRLCASEELPSHRSPPRQQRYLGHQLVERRQEVEGGDGLLGAAHGRDARRRQELLPQSEGVVQAFGES